VNWVSPSPLRESSEERAAENVLTSERKMARFDNLVHSGCYFCSNLKLY